MTDNNNNSEKLEALFHNLSEGVILQNADGKIVKANSSICTIFGLTEDQILGRTSMDPRWRAIGADGSALPGVDHPTMIALRTGIPQKNILVGVHRPDGELRWMTVSAIPLFKSENDKPYQVVAAFHDVTEDRKARANVEKLNERLSLVISALQLGTWDWDLRTNQLTWDDSFYDLLGLEKAIYKDGYEATQKLIHPDDAARVNQEIAAILSNKETSFKSEFRMCLPLKGVRVIASKGQCFYDVEGNPEKMVGANWDITESYDAAKALEDSQVRLMANSKMSALGEMAGGVAHEINNPLAIIVGKAALIKRKIESKQFSPESIIEDLIKIESTGHRIAKITRGLSAFARNSEHDLMAATKMSSVISDTLELCRERFKARDVALLFSSASEELVECRPSQISQIIMNLVGNAYDAVINLPEKWVELSIEAGPKHPTGVDQIRICVRDSGNGIPKPIVERIMEPFFTTKEVDRGTGLGLSISKGLAESHHGSLAYELDRNHTRFILTLPVKQQSTVYTSPK